MARPLRSQHKDGWYHAVDMVLTLAREFAGMTLNEIGMASGGMDYSAVSEAIKRFKIRKKQIHKLDVAFSRTLQMLKI